MSGKDFIKIMLCICGYDRNINVSIYHGDDNAVGYEIYGEDREGNSYDEKNCEGLIYNIQALIDDFKNKNGDAFIASDLLTRYNLSVNQILNDKIREDLNNGLT